MRAEAHLHIGRARKGMADCISVRDLPNGRVRNVSYLSLRDATFAVQPAGLARFRETGQKNVHAYVRGTHSYEDTHATRLFSHPGHGWSEAYYNPVTCDTFIDKATSAVVDCASHVILSRTKVYYRV